MRSVSTSHVLTIFLLAIVCSGCAGYQIGHNSLYRADIRTVHVPVARSDSFRKNLGERLTEAVCKEIEQNTPYKLTDADSADSVLNIQIVSETKRVLAESRFDDARDIETDFFVQMSWVDRRGDLIATGPKLPFDPLSVNISQTANFVPEAGQSLATAHQEAIQRLAAQIREQMEARW